MYFASCKGVDSCKVIEEGYD